MSVPDEDILAGQVSVEDELTMQVLETLCNVQTQSQSLRPGKLDFQVLDKILKSAAAPWVRERG